MLKAIEVFSVIERETEFAMTGNQDKVTEVVRELRDILGRLDELELWLPAIKVAEAIEILAPSSHQPESGSFN